MFNKKSLVVTLCYVALLVGNCQNVSKTDEADKNNALLATIVQTQNLNAANLTIATLNNSQFILNGSWNSFTGNGTTSNTIVTISAKSGSNGVILNDSSGFGGYSSCAIVTAFDNSAGYYVSQNPENNGGCFAGDTNKGKFFKTIFFAEGSKYWTCTINTPVATSALAVAVTDNTTKTSPGTTGCGGFSWSRLEKR
ncbi:MAG TPA: hypothetical protein PK079_04900 [Leptospiraceae bacterium]|nr:hypothetical protein [Leptospiraceae bacterium]HMW04997.1 hypothetical protein [Leptospiraceae bacterium]HMX35097.1 hypothetical protein [Leptospiraceae bacterium]HMY30782.1 hypothetical protein [Leptospiraceae bacterium]HMZ66363.1 hypothetical protein [Leptospiraceae bacterium]